MLMNFENWNRRGAAGLEKGKCLDFKGEKIWSVECRPMFMTLIFGNIQHSLCKGVIEHLERESSEPM